MRLITCFKNNQKKFKTKKSLVFFDFEMA